MVLSSPGGALVSEVEAVSAPGMTNQIVDSAESVKRTTEITAEQRMKTLTYSGGCRDLKSSPGRVLHK
jgi:hypothetical protein